MDTETWLRNPADYIREAVEVNHLLIAWDRGYLRKRNLDGQKYVDLQVSEPLRYRMLFIGDQGTAEVTRETSLEKPAAVYPTWEYGESQSLLEELIFQPVGEDAELCEDTSIPRSVRPVMGQEHRVVISDLPNVGSGAGKSFLRYLAGLQEEAPSCIIHVHGSYSFRMTYGLGFRATDIEPRELAQKGQVYLPNGKRLKYEQLAKNMQWVTLLGFQYADLKVPRNRCMYNIKSALWAGSHWHDNINFRTQGPSSVKPDATTQSLPQVNHHRAGNGKTGPVKPGDKFLCDSCSLVNECKYYRKGAVCSVPGTEGSKMADMFRSRDSGRIIDALGSIVGKQADRVERGLQDEELEEELDPEVTSMMNSLFRNGVQLAKLISPELNGKGNTVNVAVGGGGSVGVSSSQQLTASIVSELESQGIAREDITPEMIANVLDPSRNEGQPAIEAQVVREERADAESE